MNPVGASLFTSGDLVRRLCQRSDWLTREEVKERTLRMAAAGFDFVELVTDLGFIMPDLFDDDMIDWFRHVYETRGTRFTMHLPFYSVWISSHIESVRTGSVDATLQVIERFASLPLEGYVLHTGNSPFRWIWDGPAPVLPESIALLQSVVNEASARSLERLLQTLPKEKVWIENLPDVPFEMADAMAKRFDTATCLDVGHVFLRFDDLDERLTQWKPRMGHIHFHDVHETPATHGERPQRRDHRQLGTGILDTERYARWIAEHLPTVTVCLEMDLDAAIASLPVWREHVGPLGTDSPGRPTLQEA